MSAIDLNGRNDLRLTVDLNKELTRTLIKLDVHEVMYKRAIEVVKCYFVYYYYYYYYKQYFSSLYLIFSSFLFVFTI
jgi:hypothetical protein